jgi:hypothetical protein
LSFNFKLEFILKMKSRLYGNRDRDYKEYLRVVDFAKKSALLLDDTQYPYTNSNIMRVADDTEFDFVQFSELFLKFKEFLAKCFELKLNLMISGSSVLHSTTVTEKIIPRQRWKPVDADIYLHATCDQQQTLKIIDRIIRDLYIENYQIRLFRTPYILTWLVIEHNRPVIRNEDKYAMEYEFLNTHWRPQPQIKDAVIMSYQVILSPCLRWEHVFAGYHTDMVCAGYLTLHQKFIVTSRFDHWKDSLKKMGEEGVYELKKMLAWGNDHNLQNFRQYYVQNSRGMNESNMNEGFSYFFPDLVSPRYRERVANAREKYLHRGYATIYVEPFGELYIQDIERSGDIYSIGKLLEDPCDIAMHINNLDGIERHGLTLADVYLGETFATVLETMSCFRKCPGGCGNFVIGYADSETGFFCEQCNQIELDKIQQLNIALSENNKLTAFVTGARCGLGRQMKLLFESHQWLTYGTTRFVNLTENQPNMIELDLKDQSTWANSQVLLEKGLINVLVLSASETLHYPDDDNSPLRSNPAAKEGLELDWTNDFQRQNSGVWHKTLDQHTNQEIISPLLANVAGTARLLSSFLKGVKLIRSMESLNSLKTEDKQEKKTFTCIVVTSFEGRFVDKTPFHPITNACKSAIEQIVWTVQAQAKFLDCSIVLSDPGWVYTESAFGKTKGPVSIEYGVAQILEPLVTTLKERSPFKIFRRETKNNTNNDYTTEVISKPKHVFIRLEPCRCIIKFDTTVKNFITKCPSCESKTYINSRNIYDFRSQIIFVLIAKQFNIPRDITNIILRIAQYPVDLEKVSLVLERLEKF